jgi:hypothetical protein
VNLDLAGIILLKLKPVAKELWVDWCTGIGVHLNNVVKHVTMAILVFQVLQQDNVMRLGALVHSVQNQFDCAVSECFNLLQQVNFHVVPQLGILSHQEYNERRLSVMMATHTRLGAQSGLSGIDADLLWEIVSKSLM